MSIVISDVTKRFNKAVSLLLKNKKCKSVKQFARECGLLPQSLSEVKMLRRNVTLEMLEKICYHYGVDGGYLLTGKKEPTMKSDEITQSKFDEIDDLLPYLENSDKDRTFACLKFIEKPSVSKFDVKNNKNTKVRQSLKIEQLPQYKGDNNKKSKLIHFRVNREIYELINEAAIDKDFNFSEYIRDIIKNSAIKTSH